MVSDNIPKEIEIKVIGDNGVEVAKSEQINIQNNKALSLIRVEKTGVSLTNKGNLEFYADGVRTMTWPVEFK